VPEPVRHHVDSVKTYAIVWISLLALTLTTSLVARVELGPFNVVVALAIAVVKMLLVALFFMHIRHSGKLTRLVVLGGLLWMLILIGLTLADVVTRGWIGVPGK
jgi:cytochrome c oxidase subunit IV